MLLFICTLLTALPITAFAEINSTSPEPKEDEMAAINSDSILSGYKQGDTQLLSTDGYIGIPAEISVYFDSAKEATPGYMTTGGTPLILYVVNAYFERTGTDSDTDIIKSMINRGYIVVVLDYKNNEKAVSPALDWSAQLIRSKAASGEFFKNKDVFPAGTYQDNIIVPGGYDVLLNDVYFSLDKHGTDGTLEKIVNVWNNDFRKYKKDTVIKWVNEDGSKKQTQNGFDGSAPTWYSDAAGKNADSAGQYIKVQYTKATEITDCVMANGTPIDLDLYMHVIYPTNPTKEVPVMTLFSSAGYAMSGSTTTNRPQFAGFLFNGYAGAIIDYPWIPMGRNDHYGYFDGSSGDKSVTGDNQSYATYTYNSTQSVTAGLRRLRYLALTEPEKYSFDITAVGSYGISKAAWATQVGSPVLNNNLLTTESNGGMTETEIIESVNEKINSFYQQLYLPGHHGETRYDNGKTETYTKNGFTINGGELQPWAVYGGKEIASGAQVVYSSCGAVVDYLEKGYAPLFITENLNDEYSTAYGTQNQIINISRSLDLPALWYEADIAHTFVSGNDYVYGTDIYQAFFDFCDYYLKGEAVKVAYTDPVSKSVITASSPITIKFIGEVSASEITKVIVTAGNEAINGIWSSQFGETEWTFTPDNAKGGVTYTLTIPSDLCGKNGVPLGSDYTAAYTTLPEISSDLEISNTTVTTDGTFFSFTVPTLTDGMNRLKLRFKAEGDSVNTLNFYKASSTSDKTGDLLGSSRISGAGIYEFDVTDYVMSGNAGETVYIFVKNENVAGNKSEYAEDFDSGIGSFSQHSYSTYEVTTFDGKSVLKVIRKTNEGKFGGEHYFYETATSLSNAKVINSGKVTPDDVGRTFIFKVKVYDTVSRPIRLMLNGITRKSDELLDHDRVYHTVQTKANEWVEFTFLYTVYEAKYGITSLDKKLEIGINATGDTEMPIYFDSVSVEEVFTDITLTSASLVSYKEGEHAYKAPSSEMPFDVNGTGYATLSEAIGALGDGGTVKLMQNVTVTNADRPSIESKNNFTFDLNGYRIYSEVTSEGLFRLAAANSTNASITFKNGSIVLTGAPLFTFTGAKTAGNGKTYSIGLENVYLTTDKLFTPANVFAYNKTTSGVAVSADFTLTDCLLDIKREHLPDRKVSIFPAGLEKLSLTYSVNGGKMIFDDLHELTICDVMLSTGSNTSGDVTKLYASESESAPVVSLKKDGVYCGFARESTDSGYGVYTVSPSGNSTEYGAIPERYTDGTQYPFAIFYNEVFVDYSATWKNAAEKAKTILDEYNGKTVYVLMRDDHLCTGGAQLSTLNGKLVLDLGGFAMTRESTLFEGACAANYNGTYDTALTVKNGTLLARAGHFLAFEQKSSADKNYDIDFENVTFAMANGAATSNLLLRCWKADGTGTVNTDLTLTNCVFDFTGSTAGSMAPTKNITVFESSQANVVNNIKVYGGEIKATAATQPFFKVGTPSNGSSLTFEKDASGDYITLTLPTATEPSLSLPTSDGTFGFATEVSSTSDTKTYTLTNNTVYTDYGSIPAEYSGSAFALFCDGSFITGVSSWGDAMIQAKEYFNSNPGKTVTVLLRKKDYASSSGQQKLYTIKGTLVLDLGGNTITNTKNTLFEGGTTGYTTHNYESNLVVKNGTLLMGAGAIAVFECRSNFNVKMSLTFNNVTFGSTADTTRDAIFNAWGDQSQYTGRDSVDITLNDCTIDLRNITKSTTVFKMGTPAKVDFNVKVNGGNIIAKDLTNVTWRNINVGDDFMTFGKGTNGEYTTLTLPSSATFSNKIYAVNESGKGMSFANGTASGENKVYALSENELVTPYGLISGTYSNIDSYPFVVFNQTGGVIGGYASWGSATSAIKKHLDSNNGKTVFTVLRKNFVNEAGTTRISLMNGNVVLDLQGYALTRGNGTTLFEGDSTDFSGTFKSTLLVKNGILLALGKGKSNSGHLITYKSSGTANKYVDMTFEGVTIAVSESQDPSIELRVIARSWGDGTSSKTYSNLVFNNCHFDFTGNTPGSLKPTSKVYLFDISAGDSYHEVDFAFNGGKLSGDMSKINFRTGSTGDTVTFNQGENGYFEFLLTGGSPISGDQTTDNGTMRFTKVGTSSGVTTYHLGVKCDYGYIPYEFYSDPETYPFILFHNGGYIGAKSTWPTASSMAGDWLDGEGDIGKTITILLQRDYINDIGGFYFSRIYGTVALDLGGHTMTREKTIFEAEAQHSRTSYIEVKNGTILAKNGTIIAGNRKTTADYTLNKEMYITFTNVKFGLAEGATGVTNLLLVIWNDQSKSSDETADLFITLNNCVFDLNTVKPSKNLTLINADDGSNNYVDGHITAIDCTVNAADMSNITIFKGTSEDEFTLRYSSLKVSGMSLRLYHDISAGFRVKKSELEAAGFTSPYLMITFNGSSYRVDGVENGDYYIFTSERISPNLIGQMLKVTLHATKYGIDAEGIETEKSVKDYCYSILGLISDKAEQKLIVDTLNYAAAAQLYVNPNETVLVNSDLTEEQIALGTQTNFVPGNTQVNPTPTGSIEILGMSVSLNNGIRIRVNSNDANAKLVVTAPNGVEWTFTSSEFEKATDETGGYFIYFRGASAAQLRTLYTFTVYDGESASDSIRYSFESYAYNSVNSKESSEQLKALVYAMMNYGQSAYDFMASKVN